MVEGGWEVQTSSCGKSRLQRGDIKHGSVCQYGDYRQQYWNAYLKAAGRVNLASSHHKKKMFL